MINFLLYGAYLVGHCLVSTNLLFRNWAKMNKAKKYQLYDKIMGKYDLPEKVGGADIIEALSFQCSMLYKNWRFRLKEQLFRNKSVNEAISSKPDNIEAEKWNWLVCEYWNDEKRKLNEPPTQPSQEVEGSNDALETQEDPLYLKLFEKTKKQTLCPFLYLAHKGSGWEPGAEKDYEALKKIHEREIEKHGEDTLSVNSAYMQVFKEKSRYVRGLGPGARPPKKSRVEGESSNEVRVELSAKIQQMRNEAATKEASLINEIETLKASNDELKTSNAELIASNDELKASVSRINIESIRREKKLREEMVKMFEEIRNGR